MKITILSIRNQEEKWVTEAETLYSEKISHLAKFEDKVVRAAKGDRAAKDQKLQAESAIFQKNFSTSAFIVGMDERGQSFDTQKFAKKMQQWMNCGTKELCFVIGGAYGLPEDVKSRCREQISLSPLTFNHWLAKVVLMEQIYRGLSICKGLPYHNE